MFVYTWHVLSYVHFSVNSFLFVRIFLRWTNHKTDVLTLWKIRLIRRRSRGNCNILTSPLFFLSFFFCCCLKRHRFIKTRASSFIIFPPTPSPFNEKEDKRTWWLLVSSSSFKLTTYTSKYRGSRDWNLILLKSTLYVGWKGIKF